MTMSDTDSIANPAAPAEAKAEDKEEAAKETTPAASDPASKESSPAEAVEEPSASTAAAKKESNPSSEVSIEELGAEEDLEGTVEKTEDAEEILPKEDGDKKKEEVVEEIKTEGAEDLGRILREEAEADRRLYEGSDDDDEDDDDIEDESVLERLVALSEMFPESLRSGTCKLAGGSVDGVKWMYSKSRNLSWIVFSSASILFLPIMIESERLGIEEMQKQQQRQILLGPGAAMSGGPPAAGGGPPM